MSARAIVIRRTRDALLKAKTLCSLVFWRDLIPLLVNSIKYIILRIKSWKLKTCSFHIWTVSNKGRNIKPPIDCCQTVCID